MRIVDVRTTVVRKWLIVEVLTDEGITGIGQSAYWGSPDACERMVNAFRPLLLGEDPLHRAHLWQRMADPPPSIPRGGVVITASIAAVDIALWDIAGKAHGVPAHVLMGGKVRDRIRLHAILAAGRLTGRSTLDDVLAEAEQLVADGFTALKVAPFVIDYGRRAESRSGMLQEAVAVVAALRDAVGADVDLAVECQGRLSVAEGVELARALEPLGIFMYEDAVPPDRIAAWRELARHVRIPLATGERLDAVHDFAELFSHGGVPIVRPDVGMAGGLTHCLKIAALADAHGVQLNCHTPARPIVSAATLQLYAAVENVGTFEFWPLDEQEPRSLLLREPLRREGGYLILPEGPGLGIELADNWQERLEAHDGWASD